MKRSMEFHATVKRGTRAVQPDIVIHARRDSHADAGPRIGLIVAKSVGSAVERHLVARRLRHVARTVLADLDSSERVVIRALPSSRGLPSVRLEQQLRIGLQHIHHKTGPAR